MRRSKVAQWLLITVLAVGAVAVAQQAPLAKAKKPAARRAGTALVVSCDVACDWSLDGEDQKALAAGVSARVIVEPGDHVVEATTEDGKDTLKNEIDIEAVGPVTLQLKLLPVRIARLKQELAQQEAAIEKFKAEGDQAPRPSDENPPPPSGETPAKPADASPGPPAGGPPAEKEHPGDTGLQPGAGATPTADATPGEKLEVSSAVAQGMLLEKTTPVYPEAARAAGVSGTVVLHGTIARDGSVTGLKVASGPDLLQQAALDAVSTWKYRPYTVNGEAVDVNTTFSVTFMLRPAAPQAEPAPERKKK